MKKKILVLAPHADDEILGCGGSIAKFSRLWYEVFVLVLTNGNEGTGTGRACVLTYTATGSSANRKRFTATNITVAADDVITLGGADQLALNSGTISDTEAGSTNVPVFLDLSGITAVTQTIA